MVLFRFHVVVAIVASLFCGALVLKRLDESLLLIGLLLGLAIFVKDLFRLRRATIILAADFLVSCIHFVKEGKDILIGDSFILSCVVVVVL